MNSLAQGILVASLATVVVLVRPATADVAEFTDKDEWVAAVGEFAFIDFVGLPHGIPLTSEFEDLGVIFTPGQNVVFEHPVFPDGVGLIGSGFFPISFTLSEPQNWVAVDYPGYVQFQLFLGEELVCESEAFGTFMVDFAFVGLLSDTPFDRVVIQDPVDGDVGIDNLYIAIGESGPDVNADGVVDVLDLIAIVLAWGSDDSAADVDDDGAVGIEDLIEVIVNWS